MSELHDYLPPKLREIAEVIGDAAALQLSDRWPGVRLHVPQRLTPDHPIVLALGLSVAQALAQRYGGDTITVPKAEAWRRKRRDQLILQAYTQDRVSGRALALQYGLHENYIYELVAKYQAQRQGDLFGGT